jgi:hypothetical protein
MLNQSPLILPAWRVTAFVDGFCAQARRYFDLTMILPDMLWKKPYDGSSVPFYVYRPYADALAPFYTWLLMHKMHKRGCYFIADALR